MGRMQRTKGKVGEREAAALIRQHTGWAAIRRVRNGAGDSDLIGVPGWSVEVKRRASATRAQVAQWWLQCVEQAGWDLPVLLYRLDRCSWRVVWPLAVNLRIQHADQWYDYDWTVEGTVAAWAAVAREVRFEKGEADLDPPSTGGQSDE
jgi:Holliday junction resolvase